MLTRWYSLSVAVTGSPSTTFVRLRESRRKRSSEAISPVEAALRFRSSDEPEEPCPPEDAPPEGAEEDAPSVTTWMENGAEAISAPPRVACAAPREKVPFVFGIRMYV